MANKVQKEKIITVNEDGEVLDTKVLNRAFYTKEEPNYVKLYLDDILEINGLSSASSGVLFALIQRMDYDNLIYLSGSLRRDIAAKLEIKPITLTKALEKFVENGIFTRKERSVYFVNPFLIAKGTWSNIQSIRLTVDYTKEGKKISTKVKFGEEDKFSSLQAKLDNS